MKRRNNLAVRELKRAIEFYRRWDVSKDCISKESVVLNCKELSKELLF